jgi:hypothetical protein
MLVSGKINMCGSEMFDSMVPNLSELNQFCKSGRYRLCPFFIRPGKAPERQRLSQSVSDWNVFHRELVTL